MERISGVSGSALAILADFRDKTIGINTARAGFAEDSRIRFGFGFASFGFGFSGNKIWFALTSYCTIRLLDTLSVWSTRVRFTAGHFN